MALRPKIIKELVERNLVDKIALDFKAPDYKFKKLSASNHYHKLISTIKFLIEENFDFEVRTTVHTELLDTSDINYIIDDLVELSYQGIYYLQNFLDVPTIDKLPPQTQHLNIKDLKQSIPLSFRNFPKLANS